jgi:hypothetical protein
MIEKLATQWISVHPEWKFVLTHSSNYELGIGTQNPNRVPNPVRVTPIFPRTI